MVRNRFDQFVALNNSAMKSIQRIKAQKMKKYDLTSAHTNCLYRLRSAGEDGMTQVELVRQEMMDASQISRVLRELTEKEYVALDGEAGRYRRRYSLTQRGREIASEIFDIVEEIHGFVACDIEETELEAFYKIYEEICRALSRAEEIYLEKND
jgi:DNA-binding MarR family transcriptional regulator